MIVKRKLNLKVYFTVAVRQSSLQQGITRTSAVEPEMPKSIITVDVCDATTAKFLTEVGYINKSTIFPKSLLIREKQFKKNKNLF